MDKAVLITEACTRLGAHLARGLAEDGWHICIHHNDAVSGAQALAEDIKSSGGSASIVKANLSVLEEVSALIGRCGQELQALINSPPRGSGDPRDESQKSPLRLSADFAKQAKAGASILNIIDQRVLKSNPRFLTDGVDKAGLLWATKTMAQSFAPNVRVNGIGTGSMLENAPPSEGENIAGAKAATLDEGSSLDTILQAARYLLSAEAVTGQIIAVESGQNLPRQTPDLIFGGA